MRQWSTRVWQCFGLWLLLVATASPDLHCFAPRLFGEHEREEKEEKNGPTDEVEREAVVHVAHRHCGRRHEQHPLDAFPTPLPVPAGGAAWRGQVCPADAVQGERGLCNGCGAILLR